MTEALDIADIVFLMAKEQGINAIYDPNKNWVRIIPSPSLRSRCSGINININREKCIIELLGYKISFYEEETIDKTIPFLLECAKNYFDRIDYDTIEQWELTELDE